MKIRKTLLRILEVRDKYGNYKYYPVIQRELKFLWITYRRYLEYGPRSRFETIQEYAKRLEISECWTKEGALYFNSKSDCRDFCTSISKRLKELEEKRNSNTAPYEKYLSLDIDEYTIYNSYD